MARAGKPRKVTPERYPMEKLNALLTALGRAMGDDEDASPLKPVADLVSDVWIDLHGDGKSLKESDADLNWRTALMACALMARVPGAKKKFAVAACVGKNVAQGRVEVIEKYVQQLRAGSTPKALEVRQWAMDEALYQWAEGRLKTAMASRSTGKKSR